MSKLRIIISIFIAVFVLANPIIAMADELPEVSNNALPQLDVLPTIVKNIPDPAEVLGFPGTVFKKDYQYCGIVYNLYLYEKPDDIPVFLVQYTDAAEKSGFEITRGEESGNDALFVTGGDIQAVLLYDYQGYMLFMVPNEASFIMVDYDIPDPMRFLPEGFVLGEHGVQPEGTYYSEYYFYNFETYEGSNIDISMYAEALKSGKYPFRLVDTEVEDYTSYGWKTFNSKFNYTGPKSVTPIRVGEKKESIEFHLYVSEYHSYDKEKTTLEIKISPSLSLENYSTPVAPETLVVNATTPPNQLIMDNDWEWQWVSVEVDCPSCIGGRCSVCNGRGYVYGYDGYDSRIPCDKKCSACNGKGTITQQEYQRVKK